jgi:hypothetical protein
VFLLAASQFAGALRVRILYRATGGGNREIEWTMLPALSRLSSYLALNRAWKDGDRADRVSAELRASG